MFKTKLEKIRAIINVMTYLSILNFKSIQKLLLIKIT